jgi:hypothetical protein
MQTAAPQVVFGCTLVKGKLILKGRKHDEASAFFSTLPSGRWDNLAGAWSAEATPSAAWRLLNECPVEIEADDRVLSLAALFAESLDVVHEGQQPSLRKMDLWRHQIDAYHFADAKGGAMLAMGMGCGKSAVAVDLIVNRESMRTLILCPVSVLGVWRREFEKHAGRPVEVLVLDKGTVADKTRQGRCVPGTLRRSVSRRVVVINYESAWRDVFATLVAQAGVGRRRSATSHTASKGHDAAVSKYCAALGKVAKFRLCLTGTPMPHSPLDLFGQFRFLDRGSVRDVVSPLPQPLRQAESDLPRQGRFVDQSR